MFKLIAIIISIILQFIAVIIAIRLASRTRYRISWILIGSGFLFMGLQRGVDLYQYILNDFSEPVSIINNWLSVAIAILLSIGVFIIPGIFNYLGHIENIRKISEGRVLNAIIHTEEKERMRFAKDLHDGLGPLLSSLKLSVSALLQTPQNTHEKEILKNANDVIDEAIKSIKEISNNLSPYVLNHFGLATAIKSFTDKIKENKLIEITFTSNMFGKRIANNIEVIVYRALCELINNTLKHAEAKNIFITLLLEENELILSYRDDGKGFNVSEQLSTTSGGMGLQNIISRIRTINGNVIFTSEKNAGSSAVITINNVKG